ncbi:MAG: aminotransferase class III-fold pyridoxal phosphate-dependent enzyme, partial [Geodermatophilales bacterium]|nr:aminotransferase class III-fold pyridoxal phosphate-dependent enzyme [Geodermatophilales bacterium]
FAPLPGGVRFVPYGDAEALAGAVGEQTAMVLLEPMLGEGGVLPAPAGYLAAAAQTAADAGALFAVDEVQTGIGRTGSWFMHQADGLQPDLITLAKALGGGLPMGATLAFGDAADLMTAGAHGTTFGGNPIAAAAALAVLDTIRDEGLLERAKEIEHRFTAAIEALGHPGITGVRGRGALLGVVLTADVAAALEARLRAAGYLTNAVAPGVLRLAPPLVLSDEQVDAFVAALPAALDAALESTP